MSVADAPDPQMPIVKPFQLGGFRFTDIRSDPILAVSAGSAILKFVDHIAPRELLCNVQSTTRRDREIARRLAWDRSGNGYVGDTPELSIDPAILEEELARFNLADVRHPLEIFLGDLAPLNFAMERGDTFLGAWQWYAIRVVSSDDSRLRIRAGWFPALIGISIEELANLSIDLVEAFVQANRQMAMEDGRILDIVQASAPMDESGDGDPARLVRLARLRLERAERNGRIRYTRDEDPAAATRDRVRITDPAANAIEETELLALDQRRREAR